MRAGILSLEPVDDRLGASDAARGTVLSYKGRISGQDEVSERAYRDSRFYPRSS